MFFVFSSLPEHVIFTLVHNLVPFFSIFRSIGVETYCFFARRAFFNLVKGRPTGLPFIVAQSCLDVCSLQHICKKWITRGLIACQEAGWKSSTRSVQVPPRTLQRLAPFCWILTMNQMPRLIAHIVTSQQW